jgi:hypothetical protein
VAPRTDPHLHTNTTVSASGSEHTGRVRGAELALVPWGGVLSQLDSGA